VTVTPGTAVSEMTLSSPSDATFVQVSTFTGTLMASNVSMGTYELEVVGQGIVPVNVTIAVTASAIKTTKPVPTPSLAKNAVCGDGVVVSERS
jgi:hypothetical protein